MPAYNIRYTVTHIQQTVPNLCWSAAVSMMLGSNMTAGPGTARLSPQGGLMHDQSNIEVFARSYGLNVAPPASYLVSRIAEFMRCGPIVMLGIMPRRHAIVISELVGDGTPAGTIVAIHDPFRTAAASPLRMSYQDLMTGAPWNIPQLQHQNPTLQWAPSEYILYKPTP